MGPIQVLIIDDHPLLRLGVRHSIETTPGLVVAGECGDVAATRDWLAGPGRADVAVLDRGLPDGDGLDLIPALKDAGMKIIVLSVADGDDEIRAAIDAGVDGYLIKSSETRQVSHAVGVVANNAGPFPPQALKKLYRAAANQENPLARLSPREREIADFVADGHSNKVIGVKLNLSDNTVRNHLANIMQKLNLRNRVQLATLVLRQPPNSGRA